MVPSSTCSKATLSSLPLKNTAEAWTQKANFGGSARDNAVGFSIGSKGYIGTGKTSSTSYKNDFWEYDPSTNTWSQKANFGGTARHSAVGFSIGAKGYIGTGYDGSRKNDFWEYDPSANTWTQKANFGGSVRDNAVGFSIGAKGYIGTGSSGSAYKNDFWEYNPSANTWTQKASFGGSARYEAVGINIGSKGYIGTGYDGSSKNDFWEYNPSTNTWTQKANFGGSARSIAVGFSIGSKGYIGTGWDLTSGSKNDFWEYDPSANLWIQKANFGGSKRNDAVGFSIGSKGFIGTGYAATGNKNDFWEYQPRRAYTKLWSPGGSTSDTLVVSSSGIYSVSLTDSTTGCVESKSFVFSTYPAITPVISGPSSACSTATLRSLPLKNTADAWVQKANFVGSARQDAVGFSIGTKGYIGTGHDGSSYKNDFWEYDPSANTWTQKANFGGTARDNAVGFSIASKGYIGTGYSQNGDLNNDFWEYDPIANTWIQKANFGGTARFSAVGFSMGSKGYIGTGSDGARKNDFWEYDPSTNAWTQKSNFGGTARSSSVGFSIGSKGYIGTGWDGSGYKNDFWEYNPSTNAWTQKVSFGGTARWNAVGFSIGSKGYIGTGFDGLFKIDFWEFDPSANTWTQKAHFGGTGRYNAVGFSIGSKGYIGTGFDGLNKNDFREYSPTKVYTKLWSPGGSTADTIVVSSSGIYSVSTTDIGTGCVESKSFVFSRYPNPSPTISGPDRACQTAILSSLPLKNTTDAWIQKANFGGTARDNAVGFSIGSKGYIGTGHDGSLKKDFWEYDPSNNTWSQKANFGGTARHGAVGFSIGSKGYIGTGADGVRKKDFWEYDPISNAWTQKANFGGTARQLAVGFSIGSKGYIGTGHDGSSVKNDFWEYDPISNTWTQNANFGGTARYSAVGFSIGAKGYIGTGHDGSLKKDFWEYDPSTNTWTQKANFGGTARIDAVGFSIGSKGYIGTGIDGSSNKNDFWEYNPIANTWTQKVNFGGTARLEAVGFSIGSKGYIGTGSGGGRKNDFYEYSPAKGYTKVWSPGGSTADTVLVSTTGNYAVTLTDTSTGCIYSLSKYILFRDTIYTSSFSASICTGQSYLWNGIPQTATGNYNDTLMTALGCDSIVTLNLTVSSAKTSSFKVSICSNDSFVWNGITHKTSGNYLDTFTVSMGCDSIVTLNLTVNPLYTSSFSATICSSDSFIWNDIAQHTTGKYLDTFLTSEGCDSIVTLNLTVNPTITSSFNATICSNQFYSWNEIDQTTSGNYIDTFSSVLGCDSIVTLNLTVNPMKTSSFNATICSNQIYTWNGIDETTSGNYLDTFTTILGCDSIVTLNLTVHPVEGSIIKATICYNQFYTWNGIDQTTTGYYLDTLTTALGCDSIVTLDLNVIYPDTSSFIVSICSNQTYTWNGIIRNTTGSYADTFTNLLGCDSIVVLHLISNPVKTSSFNSTICSGDTYIWNGIARNTTGSYIDTFHTWLNCDSIVTLNLTVNPVKSGNINATICENQPYLWNGQSLTKSGVYLDTLVNAKGCDSFLTLNLTVLKTSGSTKTATICGNETYLFKGKNLNSIGVYYDTVKNFLGCDSVITLKLKKNINNKVDLINGTQFIAQATNVSYQWIRCNPYQKIAGQTKQTFSTISQGSYAVVLNNGQGCFDTSNCIELYSSGVLSSSNITTIIYPNPSNGLVNIDMNKKHKSIHVKVYDLTGKMVFAQSTNNKDQLKLDLSALNRGLYVIELESDELVNKYRLELR
jgi:N-acetylneuraminic acid mutarotase